MQLEQQVFCAAAHPLNDPAMAAVALPRTGDLYVYKGNDMVSKTIADGSLWEMDSLREILWAMEQPLPPSPCNTSHKPSASMQQGASAGPAGHDPAGGMPTPAEAGVPTDSLARRSLRPPGGVVTGHGPGRTLLPPSEAGGGAQGAATASAEAGNEPALSPSAAADAAGPLALSQAAPGGGAAAAAAAAASCSRDAQPQPQPQAGAHSALFVDVGAVRLQCAS